METFHRLEYCHELPPKDLVSPVLSQCALGALAFPDIHLWQYMVLYTVAQEAFSFPV